jgi:hypothetical protein
MNIQTLYGNSFIILQPTDTGEFLQKFEFFNPDPPQWTTDPCETLRFNRPDYAMINGRLVLERLGGPMNRTVGLKTTEVTIKGDELIVGRHMALCLSGVE